MRKNIYYYINFFKNTKLKIFMRRFKQTLSSSDRGGDPIDMELLSLLSTPESTPESLSVIFKCKSLNKIKFQFNFLNKKDKFSLYSEAKNRQQQTENKTSAI